MSIESLQAYLLDTDSIWYEMYNDDILDAIEGSVDYDLSLHDRMVAATLEVATDMAGWYYWYCMPGCQVDRGPFGPFPNVASAIANGEE